MGDWKGFWTWERELRGSYRRGRGGPGWHLRPSAPFGTSAPDGVRAMDTDEPHALGGAGDDQDELRADVEEEWAKVLAKEGARFRAEVAEVEEECAEQEARFRAEAEEEEARLDEEGRPEEEEAWARFRAKRLRILGS